MLGSQNRCAFTPLFVVDIRPNGLNRMEWLVSLVTIILLSISVWQAATRWSLWWSAGSVMASTLFTLGWMAQWVVWSTSHRRAQGSNLTCAYFISVPLKIQWNHWICRQRRQIRRRTLGYQCYYSVIAGFLCLEAANYQCHLPLPVFFY